MPQSRDRDASSQPALTNPVRDTGRPDEGLSRPDEGLSWIKSLDSGVTLSIEFTPISSVPQHGSPVVVQANPSGTIFVVDDDPDVLASLHFLLESEGFRVKTFPDGPALLSSSPPGPGDCLVVDYKMKGMNGLQLVRRLRDQGVVLPVVLVTVYEEAIPEAIASGIRHIVMKPHIEDNLVAHVRDALGERRRDSFGPPVKPLGDDP